MQNSIEVINLSKSYKSKQAVNNINFKINENEIVGLLGPNGCGKTTTIGMILGLLKPTSGQILINGIDIEKVRINKFNHKKTFLVIGRLGEEKKCDQIIKIFAKLPENQNVELIFLGDGPLEDDLLKMTKKLNQSHRIFFKGAVNDVKKYLIVSDFYVSASESEGMSNALIETMSLGIPAITSNVSGVNEIVFDNENGFVFEPNDEKIFYEKIIKAINSSEEKYTKMSRLASEHMLKNFSIETISKKHIKLYKSLIENN